MNQKDIVWLIAYPSLEEGKVRPAVVVSNDEYNRKTQDIVVCAITSKLEEKPYSILIDSRNLSGGSLPLKSRVRADKILQVEKNLVIKAFAKLDSKTFDALVTEITKLVQPK